MKKYHKYILIMSLILSFLLHLHCLRDSLFFCKDPTMPFISTPTIHCPYCNYKIIKLKKLYIHECTSDSVFPSACNPINKKIKIKFLIMA